LPDLARCGTTTTTGSSALLLVVGRKVGVRCPRNSHCSVSRGTENKNKKHTEKSLGRGNAELTTKSCASVELAICLAIFANHL
jgi:hypothetical protein